jgi:hypothetical protein
MNKLILEEWYDIGDTTDLTPDQTYDLASECLRNFNANDSRGCVHSHASTSDVPNMVICISKRESVKSLGKMARYLARRYGSGAMYIDEYGDNVFRVKEINHTIKF